MALGFLALVALITAGVIVWSIDYGAIIVTLTVGYIVIVMHLKQWLGERDTDE
jgi:hypothetical protein